MLGSGRTADAAVKKIKTLLDCICDDDRVRGSLLFHKASTGRWAGACSSSRKT